MEADGEELLALSNNGKNKNSRIGNSQTQVFQFGTKREEGRMLAERRCDVKALQEMHMQSGLSPLAALLRNLQVRFCVGANRFSLVLRLLLP